jgi:hypothetical protein
METVKSLRQKGLKVRVFHSRQHIFLDNEGRSRVYEKGGSTKIDIYNKEGNLLCSGLAICSLKDNYDKKMGVRIALGRALEKLSAV